MSPSTLPSAMRSRTPLHQLVVRDVIEVAPDVHIDDVDLALAQPSFDFAQGVFATASGSEPVAVRRELALEDRFDHHFHGALHDPVADRGDAQRSLFFASGFRDVDPSDRLGLVAAFA